MIFIKYGDTVIIKKTQNTNKQTVKLPSALESSSYKQYEITIIIIICTAIKCNVGGHHLYIYIFDDLNVHFLRSTKDLVF